MLRKIQALGAQLLAILVNLPYVVRFGLSGTDFVPGTRNGAKRQYLNWMAYDLWRDRLTVQLTVGRTTYNYDVFKVEPVMYLKLRANPTPEAFQALFIHDNTHVYQSQWRWRYDGAYSNRHIKRRTV